MIKGQNAGNGPIAVDVEKDKSYYWCSCERVQSNHFVMDLIKVQNSLQLYSKLKKQKKYFFVLVNKLTTNLFVMVHTASND